ncbi:uncharacterized protein MELLADRAFT_68658 [Melampsora larici-populina 98AG31]|uniref:Uncharacterized protein n=1 Tax=Melampsora larici-populina (strain 98AG31 / pathotype 3-4-7) TaxID=747676 RepID=F4S7L6_MELLP|nr:uncharacterized protein MELLADRAFT_68658 [Melampsora larici-populina 98AG31]EGF99372.1 hypothetical protein MELLADRAFT_68658 [Melampsora larici-populina 98AG31]
MRLLPQDLTHGAQERTTHGGLAELGRTSPSRTQLRESTLGAFPITGKLPVIAEEDEDEGEEQPKVINIDTEESDHDLEVTPDEEDEYETDHDSQHEVILSAPDKANFISRRVARSAAWRRHFARKAKALNLKLLPLIPGYNATRWNTEFDSLNRLVQAQKVVNKLLAEDLEHVRSRKRRNRSSQKPRGYFHEIYFSPDDWNSLEELTNELAQRKELVSAAKPKNNPAPAKENSDSHSVNSVFQLFTAQEPEVEVDEVAAYLKGTPLIYMMQSNAMPTHLTHLSPRLRNGNATGSAVADCAAHYGLKSDGLRCSATPRCCYAAQRPGVGEGDSFYIKQTHVYL